VSVRKSIFWLLSQLVLHQREGFRLNFNRFLSFIVINKLSHFSQDERSSH
jgi:hypothetical protein